MRSDLLPSSGDFVHVKGSLYLGSHNQIIGANNSYVRWRVCIHSTEWRLSNYLFEHSTYNTLQVRRRVVKDQLKLTEGILNVPR